MSTHPVALIAIEQFDNLGVGYLVSVLSQNGYKCEIINFTESRNGILKRLLEMKPVMVGFSVIFQYHILQFKSLVSFLRKNGVDCHFTAGGYYASLKYDELFKFIPSLDSIVRFEGEYTLVELVKSLSSGINWKNIKGIAYKNNGEMVANSLRPPEKDLDRFPFPVRLPLQWYALDKKFATIIAGRGCIHNCSFCNNIEYNKQASGPIKRVRKPEKVAEEIEFLYHEKNCSVFLFQDDDFPVRSAKEIEWVEAFCGELKGRNLVNRIMWKINCRPDEIDLHKFKLMKDHGLFLVFLGIDDGTDSGLIRLNKKMTVAQTLEGVKILKNLNIGFDFGFMLFQPSTTFKSLRENIDFLKIICGDGYTPVTFLKLMPYFETQVENTLKKEGRLKGKPGYRYYDFQDKSLDDYYYFIINCFKNWLKNQSGLVNISRWARNFILVFSFYYRITPEFSVIKKNILRTIADSNMFLLQTMQELAIIFESGTCDKSESSNLTGYKEKITLKHDQFRKEIFKSLNEISRIAGIQKMSQSVNP